MTKSNATKNASPEKAATKNASPKKASPKKAAGKKSLKTKAIKKQKPKLNLPKQGFQKNGQAREVHSAAKTESEIDWIESNIDKWEKSTNADLRKIYDLYWHGGPARRLFFRHHYCRNGSLEIIKAFDVCGMEH